MPYDNLLVQNWSGLQSLHHLRKRLNRLKRLSSEPNFVVTGVLSCAPTRSAELLLESNLVLTERHERLVLPTTCRIICRPLEHKSFPNDLGVFSCRARRQLKTTKGLFRDETNQARLFWFLPSPEAGESS